MGFFRHLWLSFFALRHWACTSSKRASSLNCKCTSGVWGGIMLSDRYPQLLLTDTQTHTPVHGFGVKEKKLNFDSNSPAFKWKVLCPYHFLTALSWSLSLSICMSTQTHVAGGCPSGLPEVVCEQRNWKTGRSVRCKDGSRVCLVCV